MNRPMPRPHRSSLFRMLTALFLLTLLLPAAHAAGGFRVLSDSPQETVVELTIPEWTTQELEGGVLHLPTGEGLAAGVDERTGARMTPYLSRIVALADDSPPRVIVEEQVWGDWRPGLAPFGEIDNPNNLPAPTLQGSGPVVIGQPWEWRRRWVAHLFVVPVREQNGGIVPLERIRLRIEHGRSPATAAAAGYDPLVEKGVVNAAAARSFGIARGAGLKAPARTSSAGWPANPMVRIEIEQEGIYELSASSLEARGIDVSGYDPAKLRLYNNGGQPLPRTPNASRPDSLIENAIYIEGAEDGSFTGSDRILFYGRAVNSWQSGATPGSYIHTKNPYTRRNVYWLELATAGPDGKRMQEIAPAAAVTFETTVARSRLFIDNDQVIFNSKSHPESGTEWYATELLAGEQYATTFELPQVLAESDATLWISFKNLGGFSNMATVSVNGNELETFRLDTSRRSFDIPANLLRPGSNTFRFQLNGGQVYFNWLELDFLRELSGNNRIMFDGLGQDGVARVTLEGLENPWIFEVQDWDDVRYTRGETFETASSVNNPRRRIAVEESGLLTPLQVRPEGLGAPDYPNGLRDPSLGAETIFLYHPDFEDATRQLEAYVEQRDGIEVLPVNVFDIYQEFAWGLYDPVAIRDYLKYAYHHYATLPQSVLLIGDGDYDYRNITSTADDNWMPPYEDGVICRDYWYVEFTANDFTEIQMVMGRLPVQSNRELEIFVDKLRGYEEEAEQGDWRYRMVMLADDEYVETGPTPQDQIHMEQAEEFVTTAAPSFLDIRKIYIGTYPTTFDPITGGRRKPAATAALLGEINRGALMVSFIGHGNAHVWTHESVLLDSRDNQLINSGDRTPFFLAATCSWGHFDRPANESHPEQLIRRPGGAIGVIAATRLTNAYSNNRFAQAFYSRVFDRAAGWTAGESLFYAMIEHPEGTNQYYQLFGEPNMHLALPSLDVGVTEMDPDSLVALAEAELAARVRTPGGDPRPDFDGEALVTVYDSADTLKYVFVNRDGNPTDSLRYQVRGGTLFRGLVTADEGEVNARFIVPRDVKYGSQNGSVHVYAFNDDVDGVGSTGGVNIAIESAGTDDATPPEIDVYFDHQSWREGDFTGSDPTLFVRLADSSGINLTGEIGHDIRAVLDGGDEIQLTDEFTYDRDSYTNGVAETRLAGLDPGPHSLEVWAWDNANNFGRQTVEFVVLDDDAGVMLQDVLNWPNPFEDRTQFTFRLTSEAEVTIKIFTASGRKIKQIGPVAGLTGFNYPERTSFELEWDGRDESGSPVANGAYLYTIEASSSGGTAKETGKLLRVR